MRATNAIATRGTNSPDEHHPSPHFAPRLPSHVKTQVHFLEIRVHRNWQEAEQFCLEKSKSDEAGKDFSFPAIKFGAGRNEPKKQASVHLIVQHCQGLPIRRKVN